MNYRKYVVFNLLLMSLLLIFTSIVSEEAYAERLFVGNSSWYEQIPDNPKTTTGSADYIADLTKYGNPLQAGDGMPIFYADKNSPVISVSITTTSCPAGKCPNLDGLSQKDWIIAQGWNQVPIPSGARPHYNNIRCSGTGYTDGYMTIISADRLTAWDFQQGSHCNGTAEANANDPKSGTWSAKIIRKWNLQKDGLPLEFFDGKLQYDYHGTPKAGATGLLPGIVTYDDIVVRGRITHALAMGIGFLKSGMNIYPSLIYGDGDAECNDSGRNCLRYGMRLQLDPTFNCNSLENNFAKIICVALQDYGAIHVITEGKNSQGKGYNSITIENLSGHPTKSWSGIDLNLYNIPLNKLRVVAPVCSDCTICPNCTPTPPPAPSPPPAPGSPTLVP
jgi:hypothetical protein